MQRLGKTLFIALIFLAGTLFAIWTVTAPASAAPGTAPAAAPAASLKLLPVADASVISNRPADNFGASTDLIVSSNNTVAVIQANTLLRFDLSAIPAGSIIDRATLTFYQREAKNEKEWPLTIGRITQSWSDSSVTFRTQPTAVDSDLRLLSPGKEDIDITADLTVLVRQWRYEPFRYPNNGLSLSGDSDNASRLFDSMEGPNPPTLVIDYTPPPAAITIPYASDIGKLDAVCDAKDEYVNALRYQYIDYQGTVSTLYLKQDDDFLYACVEGVEGSFPLRYFGLYLDRNNGREKYATPEDLSLRVRVEDGFTAAFEGTGQSTNTWIASNYTNWQALAAPSASATLPETAEYRVPLRDLATTCGQPFGLALYHHSIADNGVDFGWPTANSSFSPSTWVQATLERPICPIRVCLDSALQCTPIAGTVVREATSGTMHETGRAGYVIDRNQIDEGTALWAMVPITVTDAYTLYYTSGAPQTVNAAAYNADPAGEMTLVVSARNPLMVHDLTVSAQWYVQGDAAKEAWLREAFTRTANLVYDFTDGQVTLGNIIVYQSEDQWNDANLKLHMSNSLQPNAHIGGVVSTTVEEIISPTLTLDYEPGSIFMGSYWNRYGAPPNQPIIVNGVEVPLESMTFDWADALAHELGHYFFFLYDTYRDAHGQSNLAVADACFGSAMGNVYAPGNQGFVSSVDHWITGCGQTEAYHMLNGRTEWETIQRWYPWIIQPTSYVAGPVAPPSNLTTVTFIAPTTPPGMPAASQLFDLNYQDNESSSGEARGFIFRGERIYEQGKPAKNATQIQLTDAQLDDRLCVYDLNDYAEGTETPRHQFGCEQITPGDSALALTKNNAWEPLVDLRQTSEQQVMVELTQTLPAGTQVFAKLYPEYGEAIAQELLVDANGTYSHTFDLSEAVPPLYIQLWIDETPTDPATRREVVADRGTGGGGAFGPARHLGGVLVLSSDGKASFEREEGFILNEGESIAWQSMPGTPTLPLDKRIIGQSYRLDAFPPELVAVGRVAIEFSEEPSSVQAAQGTQNELLNPTLYFWENNMWLPLSTTLTAPVNAADGVRVAAAASQGEGIYAVLVDDGQQRIFLPLIQR